jgi:hypothetical protein
VIGGPAVGAVHAARREREAQVSPSVVREVEIADEHDHMIDSSQSHNHDTLLSDQGI